MTDQKWTTADIPDQRGRTGIITGANRGLGYEVAKVLARRGASVVMACRDQDRASEAKRSIEEANLRGDLTVLELDLADLDSVRRFANEFERRFDELHVLCNNAGVMAVPRTETADGFETQFGVNHLGHFALTGLLVDRMVQSAGESRVVTQSSRVHRRGNLDFDDLHAENDYDKWDAYGDSKLANLLFAYELQRQAEATGIGVTSVACHPGYADTDLTARGPRQYGSRLRLIAFKLGNRVLAQSASMGALPMLFAATSPSIEGGEYVGPGGIANMRGHPEIQSSSDASRDKELASRVWSVSEELTGVKFDLPVEVTADD